MSTVSVAASAPSFVILAAAGLNQPAVPVVYGEKISFELKGVVLTNETQVAKVLARLGGLFGAGPLQNTEVDHWVAWATRILAADVKEALQSLDAVLQSRTFLVGGAITLADLAVFAVLRSADTATHANVARWLAAVRAVPAVGAALAAMVAKVVSKEKVADQGKFVELEGAEMGKVCTRFPPEASGYLHIGHAKAALLNQYFAQKYNGRLIMRFDDTNPAKESAEFEKVILEDLQLLGIKPTDFTHTSDHFDTLYELALKLINEGKAYVDDTPAEQMKLERSKFLPSASRDIPAAESLRRFQEMKDGSEYGQKCCLRAKIDHASLNGTLRDPVLYRCKPEVHVRTGSKYKMYPTYDFACPIVDSIEGVTHALRTTEYHDRDDQYRWLAKACGLRVPVIWDFARLNLKYTVMSKRMLTTFVKEKQVDGWGDARFPTVRGILRHGMTVEGLKQFILGQGSSKNICVMDWGKIWAYNRRVIDPLAPRFQAIVSDAARPLVKVTVTGPGTEQWPTVKTVNAHPKDPTRGTKQLAVSTSLFLEEFDAATLKVGDIVTLVDIGNAVVETINRSEYQVAHIALRLDLANTNYSNTVKLTWVADHAAEAPVDIKMIEYDYLIVKPGVPKADTPEQQEIELKAASRPVTMYTHTLLGEAALAHVEQGDIIQITRKGFFICDQASCPALNKPLVLIAIPDGHTHAPGPLPAQPATQAQLEEAQKRQQQQEGIVETLKKSKADQDTRQAAEARLKECKRDVELVQGRLAVAQAHAVTAAIVATVAAFDRESGGGGDDDDMPTLAVATADAPKVAAAAAVEPSKAAKTPKAKKEKDVAAAAPAPAAAPAAAPVASDHPLIVQAAAQGEVVRKLKEAKAPKEEITAAVNALLALKAEFKKTTGQDFPAPAKK